MNTKNEKIPKGKKLHLEIMPANWTYLKKYIDDYNNQSSRYTPEIKYADVINEALHVFLSKKLKKDK